MNNIARGNNENLCFHKGEVEIARNADTHRKSVWHYGQPIKLNGDMSRWVAFRVRRRKGLVVH